MTDVAQIVVAFVARRDGRILVQPRTGDPAMQGLWELPGGTIAPGEPHTAALAREVREETGLEVEVGELVCALCHLYDDRRVAIHAYLCAPASELAIPVSGKAAAARWLTPSEYRALPIPAANPPLLDALDRLPELVRARTMPG
jgi:mutator protein MutT